MSYEAGQAFLQVVPSFAGVVDAITEEFSKDGDIAAQAFRESFETSLRNLTASVSLDTTEARAELDAFDVDVDKTGAKSPKVRVSVDGAPEAIAELEGVALAADAAAGEEGAGGAGAAGGSGLAGLGATAADSGPQIGIMTLAIVAAIPALSALGGLAGGALSTLPAIFGGLALGAGALYLGLSGVIPAISAYSATLNTTGETAAQVTTAHNNLAHAMAGLSPAGQTFVSFVGGTLLPIFSQLKTAAQTALLPGLTAGLQAMLPFFQSLGPFITNAASGIGQFFDKLGQFIGSASGLSQINTILQAGSGFMSKMGDAAVTLFEAFTSIGAQASPIVKALGDGIKNLVDSFAKWAENGGFQKFLDWLRQNGPQLISDIGNFAKGAAQVFVALAPIGVQIVNLVGAFGRFLSALTPVVKIISVLDALQEKVFVAGFNAIVSALDFLEGHWQVAWNAIKAVADAAWQILDSTIFQPLVNFFTSTIPGALSTVTGAFSTAWNAIQGAVSAVWSWLVGNVFTPIGTFFTATIPGWIGTLVGFFESLPGRIGGAIAGLFGIITGAFGDVAGWVNTWIIQPVVGFFNGLISTVGTIFGKVGSAIEDAFKAAFNFVAKIWNDTVGSLSFTIPGWVPFIGGDGFSMPKIPTFHDGGIVPGPPGANVPAILQAGELVISRSDLSAISALPGQSNGSGGSYSPTIYVTANDPRTAAAETMQRFAFDAKTRGF